MMTPGALPSLPLICTLLRGEPVAWPAANCDESIVTFLDDARSHGVMPLLDARFIAGRVGDGVGDGADHGVAATWPEAIRRACHDDAINHAGRELASRAETTRVLAALDRADIRSLLMKGAGLAYSHYPRPALRPRADCDLLVASSQREAARGILHDLGYRRIGGPAGKLVGYQYELHHVDVHDHTHNVDLHWRISNAQSFAWLFAFDELAAAAVPVPALGANARRLGDVHALMLALLHRAGNNQFMEPGFGDRLIWLYDVHLLVGAMTDDDRARFIRLAESKRVGAIAIDGLRHCADAFRSPRVEALILELERGPDAQSGAAFLRAGKIGREWLELRAIPTFRDRLTYVANRLVPSADYMRERFPDGANRALPLLHARRWLHGIGGRLPVRRR
jgi:hypothetical protein